MNEAVAGSGLMSGRRGLIMGVANERSIAWSIAAAIAKEGGELAFTFQNESIAKRVQPLADSVGSDFVLQCDVGNCLLYTSPSPRDQRGSRMPSSA